MVGAEGGGRQEAEMVEAEVEVLEARLLNIAGSCIPGESWGRKKKRRLLGKMTRGVSGAVNGATSHARPSFLFPSPCGTSGSAMRGGVPARNLSGLGG